MKLLGISGSLRAGSTNTALLREAARLANAESFDLADLNMPLYDGDLEAEHGLPKQAQALVDAISGADAVIMATPEYNGNLTGVLKNALDWISRSKPNPLIGKPLAIMSAAAGRSGGVRAQYSLRLCLVAFRPDLLQGPEIGVANSGNAFDENGMLTNERSIADLSALMDGLRARIAR